MKISRILILQMLLSACFVTHADFMTIQGFYKQLGDALSERNGERIVALLGTLDGSTIWSFGSGVGPVDTDLLQSVAVDSFLMLGRELRHQERRTVSDLDEKWCAALLASPTNTSVILRLLQNPKPAVRLIALRKLAEADQLDSDVVSQLKILSGVDSYVRIVKKPVKVSRDTPPPPDLVETDIEFPLRTIARQILLSKGCLIEYKPEKEACEGVRYFAKLWASNPRRRADIQEAISLLGPGGYGVKAVKELSETEKDSPVYRIFWQQLEKE